MAKRDPYVAICKASEVGAGVHLTAEEVLDMSMDDAISTCAYANLSPENRERYEGGGWKAVKNP